MSDLETKRITLCIYCARRIQTLKSTQTLFSHPALPNRSFNIPQDHIKLVYKSNLQSILYIYIKKVDCLGIQIHDLENKRR